jgi:hypothetical protein
LYPTRASEVVRRTRIDRGMRPLRGKCVARRSRPDGQRPMFTQVRGQSRSRSALHCKSAADGSSELPSRPIMGVKAPALAARACHAGPARLARSCLRPARPADPATRPYLPQGRDQSTGTSGVVAAPPAARQNGCPAGSIITRNRSPPGCESAQTAPRTTACRSASSRSSTTKSRCSRLGASVLGHGGGAEFVTR